MCCAIACVIKLVMGIVNTLLLIMGIVLLAIGGLLMWGIQYFMKSAFDIEAKLKELLKTMSIEVDTGDVLKLISANSFIIGAIALGIGAVLIALAIIGIIAVACCNVKKLLIVVLVILIILTLGLIVLAFYYGIDTDSKLLEPLAKTIQDNFINKYKSWNSTEPESILVNLVQITAACCGMNNYKDYDNVTTFERTYYNYTLAFPLTCCEYNLETLKIVDAQKCVLNKLSPNKDKGCWMKLKPILSKYLSYAFASLGITIAILIAAIIATIILIKCADKLE